LVVIAGAIAFSGLSEEVAGVRLVTVSLTPPRNSWQGFSLADEQNHRPASSESRKPSVFDRFGNADVEKGRSRGSWRLAARELNEAQARKAQAKQAKTLKALKTPQSQETQGAQATTKIDNNVWPS